jgi:hypothetical protein
MTPAERDATMENHRDTYLITEYHVSIRTAPHTGWMAPQGWGPYYTETEGRRALRQVEVRS